MASDDDKPSLEIGNKVSPTTSAALEKAMPQGRTDKMLMSIDDAIDETGTGKFQRRLVFAAGLCFASDSMEVMLLSFLGLILKDEWSLSPTESATITSIVFAGAFTGTLILGRLGDLMGRRPIFLASALVISVSGFLTASVNSLIGLLFARFMVGFGIGGLTVPFDILAEFLPTKSRGPYLLVTAYFWTMGSISVPIVAYLTVGQGAGWRLFVFLLAIPCVISFVVCFFMVPESPRWLLSRGRADEALAILRTVARVNGKDPNAAFPSNVEITVEAESSNFGDLFVPQWRKITLLLWGVWTGFAFAYYGTVILNTRIFEEDVELKGTGDDGDDEVSVSAHFAYGKIIISTSAETVGLFLAMNLVDRIGRIGTQVLAYSTGGIVVMIMCIVAQVCPKDAILVPLAFLARMIATNGNNITWILTAEILPTKMRTTGHSAANAAARLGALSVAFVVSGRFSYVSVGIVMLIVQGVVAALVSFLPETSGRGLGRAVEVSATATGLAPKVHPDNSERQGVIL